MCLNHFVKTIHRISRISARDLPLVARAVFAADSRAWELLGVEELEDRRNLFVPQVGWLKPSEDKECVSLYIWLVTEPGAGSRSRVSQPRVSFLYFRNLNNTLTGVICFFSQGFTFCGLWTELVETQFLIWAGHILLHVKAASWWTFCTRQSTTSQGRATSYALTPDSGLGQKTRTLFISLGTVTTVIPQPQLLKWLSFIGVWLGVTIGEDEGSTKGLQKDTHPQRSFL